MSGIGFNGRPHTEVCGDAALYFDPHSAKDLASKLRQASSDDGLRAALSKAGAMQAQKFSWEMGARQLLKICREVASTKM